MNTFNTACATTLMLSAGTSLAAGDLTPIPQKAAKQTRSLYISMSGERVELRNAADVRGSGETRTRVWVSNRANPCQFPDGEANQGGNDSDGADDIPGTADDDDQLYIWTHSDGSQATGYPSLSTVTVNWGDVPADTRINALATWLWHDVNDNDINPGTEFVEDFEMVLGFLDGFNGDVPPAGPVTGVVRYIIGDWEDAPDDLEKGFVDGTYFVLDLDDGVDDMSLELGDTDEMGPASGFFNPLSFQDTAEDAGTTGEGLHDFGYFRTFNFPETLGAGQGTAFHGTYGDVEYAESQGEFFSYLEIENNGIPPGGEINSTSVHGNGVDESTGVPLGLPDDSADHLGFFNGGGAPSAFNCGDIDASEFDVPIIDWMELYFDEPATGTCVADFDGSGAVNILDVVTFLDAWNTGLDYNGDGSVNILDVVAFINDWNAAENCPTP